MAKSALACTINAGLYFSPNIYIDDATNPTWLLVSNILPGLLQCAFNWLDPLALQVAHDGATAYIRREDVTGANWQTLVTSAQIKAIIGTNNAGAIRWVEYSPLSKRVFILWLYSVTLGGIWVLFSDDYGATWTASPVYIGQYNYDAGDVWAGRAGAGTKVYVSVGARQGSYNNVFHSENGGATWTQQVTNIGQSMVGLVVSDPDNDAIAYCGAFNTFQLDRSIDGGVNYTEIDGVLQCGPICGIAFSAAWINAINSNISRFSRGDKFYWSDDYWTTPHAQTLPGVFIPSAIDGINPARTLLGKNTSAAAWPGNSHVVRATLDNGATLVNKGGANANVAGGGGDSIGYNCGGISKFGLILFTDLNYGVASGGKMSGRIIKQSENTVYLRAADGFDPFDWGGKCMRIEDITKPRPSLNPTYCQNPRTGAPELEGTLQTLAGLPTSSLVMKESLFDSVAENLENCFWDIDRRTYCKDLDYWNGWEKIRRICAGKVNTRTDNGSSYDADEAENLVTLPIIGSGDVITIRRVAVSVQQAPEAVAASWVAASVCHGEKCGSRCDHEKQCVIAMVSTMVAAASPHLLINNAGGAPGYWTDITLTEWTVDGANDVVCLGDFVLIVSDGEANPFLRSYDLGATRVELAGNADMVTNPPRCLHALDQSFVVAGAENGYIYGTSDAGTTWDTLDAGVATTQDINKVRICKTNSAVIYAIGQGNALIKSENGGETFFALTGPAVGDNLTALWIYDENHLLIGDDDGELWESSDGGETWTQQEALPEVTAAAGTTIIRDIAGCGCGVLWLIWGDTSVTSFTVDTEQYLFRNVDNGASGRWFVPENGELQANRAQTPNAVVCCGPNRALVVGGEVAGVATGFVALAA